MGGILEESLEDARLRLWMRLEPRRREIEDAALSQLCANPGSPGGEPTDGLRRAVSAGVEFGFAGIQRGGAGAGPVPPALLAEARQAARLGQPLDALLSRFLASYALLNDFVLEAAVECGPSPGSALRPTLGALAELLERVLVAVVGAYIREDHEWRRPSERRLIKSVRSLLAGERDDASELRYELDEWHVGAVARGEDATSALQELPGAIDRQLLLVRPEGRVTWSWFGGRQKIGVEEMAARISSHLLTDGLVALGEPAHGVEGWRLTHHQAIAAFAIAERGQAGVTRYADVALLASASEDRLLAHSLRQLYLAPLATGRNGGAVLRETLRAYFAAGRNVSSAASALGVSRQTVGNRLRTIEEMLGRTLESCAPEIELALRLEAVKETARPVEAPDDLVLWPD
jgi:PucR-like helix-turn-helix protein/diguanylate cyclase with GGDEF domain